MTGRVIIVTGGSSGIGFEACKYLAEGGNDVILACRSKEKGDDAVHRIKLLYPNALIQFMQVSMFTLFNQIFVISLWHMYLNIVLANCVNDSAYTTRHASVYACVVLVVYCR